MQPTAGATAAPARTTMSRWLVRAAAIAWSVFAVIALFVAVDPTAGIDTGSQRLVASAARPVLRLTPWLAPASKQVAALGSIPVAIVVMVVTGAAFAIGRRTLLPAFILGASFACVAVTVGTLKDLYLRPEPYDGASDVGFSFPSGHTAVAVAAWGGTALVVMLFAGRRLKRGETVFALACCGVALGVGAAMIARSAHWLTDVVAGAALGGAWLATTAVVAMALEARLARARRTAVHRTVGVDQPKPTWP